MNVVVVYMQCTVKAAFKDNSLSKNAFRANKSLHTILTGKTNNNTYTCM